jgi:RNA polymerase sigma-70 factor (ECF subfamily)
MSGLADGDLVRLIAEAPPGGATEAESALYGRLFPRVRLYGLKHLRDDHAAADLAQDVLLMTFDAIRSGRLREPERLASFVLGTSRMVVLDIRRGAGRRRQILETYGKDLHPSETAPAPVMDTDRLRFCLERLANRDRSVVVMSFDDDSSAEEVARELGLTAANVRVIRHRAIARLRGCMMEGELRP